jgi:hypothetical protein
VIAFDVVVVVPGLAGSVPKLHVADAPLQEPPGDERLPAVDALAVEGPRFGRLAGQIECLGRFGLHAESKLERLDAGVQAVVDSAGPVLGIQPGEQIELPPLRGGGGVRMGDVLDQPGQLLVLGVDEGPLERAGQEGRLPVLGILDRKAAGAHGEKARQVLVLGPQAIQHPGADAGPRLDRVAAVHEHQRRFVVGHLGVHRADDGDVVDVGGGLREDLAHLDAAFTVFLELERRGKRGAGLALGAERFGQRLAGIFGQGRLGIERIDVRRAAVEEEVDDALGLAGKMRQAGRERAGGFGCIGRATFVAEQPSQAEGTEPQAAAAEHFAAAEGERGKGLIHG